MKLEQYKKVLINLIVQVLGLFVFINMSWSADQALDFTFISNETISDAQGAAAILNNPAGLSLPGRAEIKSSAASLFAGQAQNYCFSYYQPVGQGRGFGLSLPWQSIDAIPRTQFDASGQPQMIGSFSDSKIAVILAYGQAMTSQISLGAAVKYYSHRLADKQGSCFAADLGVLYAALPDLSFGLTVRDLISSPFSWSDGQSERLTRQIAAGGVHRFSLQGRPAKITAAVSYQQGRTFRENLGFEWNWTDNFTFRGGCDFCQSQFYPAAGLGFNFADFSLDYSYQMADGAAGSSQVISLGWKFDQESSHEKS